MRTRRRLLPPPPHPTQLMRRTESCFLRHALHSKLTVRDQLPRERDAQPLYVIERRAAGVLGDQSREVARAHAFDRLLSRGGRARSRILYDGILHSLQHRPYVAAFLAP